MKFAHLKQFAITTVLAVSIVFSLGMGLPAAALAATPMDGMAHENTNVTNCINQHHVAPGTGQKISTNELEEDDDEPTPKPLRYFVQFQEPYTYKEQAAPVDIVRSSSFHPPDIIRLTSNIRF